MKSGIHPQYFLEATITCANCGHKRKTGATEEEIRVEICSNCHPFFTGKKVVLDTAGRVEKFNQRLAAAQDQTGKSKKKRKKSLEDRVNEELAAQLEKAQKTEAKAKS